MEIRFATAQDNPAIVALLKKSLGESLMPKSEEYWRWKHEINPFGASPVLLAIAEGEIIGVRAFMRWRWTLGGRSFEAVRAVDTATDPKFQGKGIFSKLTKALLDDCKEKGWHFVFNTPNEKSKPGYLKMGWVVAGKLPVNIKFNSPVSVMLNAAKLSKSPVVDIDEVDGSFFQQAGIDELIQDSKKMSGNHIITDHSAQSVRWRYSGVPVAKYGASVIGAQRPEGLIVYRIKQSRAGNELRITDLFCRSKEGLKQLNDHLRALTRRYKIDYVTQSGTSGMSLVSGGLSIPALQVGPVVTVKDIAMDQMDSLLGFKAWRPSLGDLELF